MSIKIGDKLYITNTKSAYYGCTGVVTGKGQKGGYYVKFEHTDHEVYIPFGYEKVAN